MALARVKYICKTCGEEVEFTKKKSNYADARSFEEWAKGMFDECPECKKKRMAREHEEENRKAAEAAKAKAWPKLTGSEKQVAWANSIREGFVSKLVEDNENTDIFKEAVSIILDNTSASWWIDHRSKESFSYAWGEALDVVRQPLDEEAVRKASKAAQTKGWPELTGNKRMVAWATIIRENYVSQMVENNENRKKALGDEHTYEVCNRLIEILLSNTSAGWWFDNRFPSEFKEAIESAYAAAQEKETES